jgi:AcrR family transcriptional regulator
MTTAEITPGAATRERLIRAAIEIAAREGLAATTTAAIAEKAGVAEGTLYRHFDSKDDLLIVAFRQMKTEVFLNAAERVDTSLPAPERLKRTWRAIYAAYRADMASFLFGIRFAESALAEKEGGEAARAIGRMVADLRRDGVASGDFKKLPVDLLVNLFLAPITYLLKSEIKGRRWTDKELDAAAEAVLAGWKT